MKAAGKCPPLFIPPPVSSPCLRCGVEPRRAYRDGERALSGVLGQASCCSGASWARTA